MYVNNNVLFVKVFYNLLKVVFVESFVVLNLKVVVSWIYVVVWFGRYYLRVFF